MKNKSVLMSIQPNWVAEILNGKKTKEIRKTKPKIATPFKCYIYCTKKGRPIVYGYVWDWFEKYVQTLKCSEKLKKFGTLNGKVVGEFVCDRIDEYKYNKEFGYEINEKDFNSTMLTANEFLNYGKQETLYGLNISELIIYVKPKKLSEFKIKSPPQSWCYVEAL